MNEKPLGMRIGESVFCAGYLAFALIAGIVFAFHVSEAGDYASTCALMTLLLGGGDAFHLVPRILANIKGSPKSPDEEKRRHFWLGLGNLVSSITMTVFYILLFDVMRLMPEAPQAGQPPQLLRSVLIAFAAVRIALCLFPQNRWFDGVGNQQWGIYRNLPFVAMGILTVLYLLVWYHARMLAILVTVSFACYMGVVLYAKEKPMMGMLMIPKTICYIWMIVIFLSAL
jgi:hypothetical protein